MHPILSSFALLNVLACNKPQRCQETIVLTNIKNWSEDLSQKCDKYIEIHLRFRKLRKVFALLFFFQKTFQCVSVVSHCFAKT